jgi:uncharacterized protein
MKRLEGKFLFQQACRAFAMYFFLLLTVAFAPVKLCAQAQADSVQSPCVPADLAALIVPEGRFVRVYPVARQPRGTARTPESTAISGATPSAPDGRAAREAYKILEREARQGRPAAMVNLAVFSLAGWGTQPNAGAALYWLHAAADQGYVPALYNLGLLYFKGCGVRQDYAEALRFFDQGSRHGDAASEVNLGYMYDHGLGVPQDHAAAVRCYRRAAESGEPQAQYNLADLYIHGQGVPQDDAAAFAWFQKAAVQGHTGARIMLGSMFAAGRGTAKDLVSAYLWISAASLQGDSRGNATLLSLECQLSPTQLTQAKLRGQSLAHTSVASAYAASLH